MKLGDIQVEQQLLEAEFFWKLIDLYLDELVRVNKLKPVPQEKVSELRKKVIDALKKKYPNSGITLDE